MRVLLIEDDEELGHSTCAGLRQYGYVVDWLKDGQVAYDYILSESFDVIVLDLRLPGRSGLAILNKLRSKKDDKTPVLVLSAMGEIENRIQALQTGADDFLAKPFDLRELSVRITALQRRIIGNRVSNIMIYKNIVLDPSAMSVKMDGQNVILSTREFVLLQKLLENTGKVVSREILTQCLYGWEYSVESNTLEVYIHGLRKKINPHYIRTVRNVGYIVEKEGENL